MNAAVPTWTTLVDAAALADVLGRDGTRVIDARATASTAVRVVDARSSLADPPSGAQAYAQGHLPGALHADLNGDLADMDKVGHGRHPLPDSDAFAATVGRWGIAPDTQVVVYDAGDGSMAAARLWWLLRLLGHTRVAVLDGGLAAWTAAGQPLTPALPDVAPLPAYPGRFDQRQIASVDEIAARLKHAPGWLLDARAGERFRGEVEPLDPVAGHVPGAVNRPFALNVHDGRLRQAAELRAALQALIGAHDPQQVVLMCGSGVTACHLLLAMEVAGLHGARVYADSWSGWVGDASRPVATGA
ncbi:sulfurtransferase [Stenotrophomonas sp. BIGb0135]|uniref:sulfurtransferase n=1 Tax=Stenotrophomonas sp. BIGb0135 TaxID=2940620 RepID=UPI00216823C0|nr:sulfurtransferase [Stenotrophomonas sp. BIGb0135]MCS4234163.1 thiosulfate/3-mercaptopyruvate sulfurtransferase [Stenotrophomonas sp. BIGb0135]